jgi:hypothetical protein
MGIDISDLDDSTISLGAYNGINLKHKNVNSDTIAYIEALAAVGYIMGPVETQFWYQTILDLKESGAWDQFICMYPMIGGTEAAHAINLRSPGTYDLTFSGTWVHSATGALPNGIDAYADTGFNASGILTFASLHSSFYSGTTAGSNNGVDLGTGIGGAGNYNALTINFSGQAYYECPGAGMISGVVANTGGLFTGSRTAFDYAIFKRNKTEIGIYIVDVTSATMPNSNLLISNDGADHFSDRQCRWASFGEGLTEEQIDSNSDLIGAIQSFYGRAV